MYGKRREMSGLRPLSRDHHRIASIDRRGQPGAHETLWFNAETSPRAAIEARRLSRGWRGSTGTQVAELRSRSRRGREYPSAQRLGVQA